MLYGCLRFPSRERGLRLIYYVRADCNADSNSQWQTFNPQFARPLVLMPVSLLMSQSIVNVRSPAKPDIGLASATDPLRTFRRGCIVSV
jgi:hypothetical protein